MSVWLKVKQFSSKSSPGTKYWVSIHPETKVLGCNCKGWTMKRPGKPRHCKHLDLITAEDVRETLRLEVGSTEYNSRAINMSDPEPIEISHGKQWWAKRMINTG